MPAILVYTFGSSGISGKRDERINQTAAVPKEKNARAETRSRGQDTMHSADTCKAWVLSGPCRRRNRKGKGPSQLSSAAPREHVCGGLPGITG